MTPAQIIALRAKVFLDSTANAFLAAGNASGLRGYLNTASSFIAWRTAVPQDEIMLNGFDWVRVSNLGIGQARVWEWLFSNAGSVINPSKLNVRAGIDEVWRGTPADLAVRDAVYVHCKRAATNAEKMLSTGTGTTAAPGDFTYQGEVSELDSVLLIFKDNGTIWTAGG